ncbi:MAG TPA: hypothetical protein VK968_02385 [Roseimicrobium sp.]|nr:hypothetical protein [Roseimicrobium sp.]
MITIFNHWLKQSANVDGLLAAGIRYTDKTIYAEIVQPGFNRAHVDQACGVLTEAFQLLRNQRVSTQQMRLTFEKGQVYGVSRTDGHCLCLITPCEVSPKLEREIERVVGEFLKLWA